MGRIREADASVIGTALKDTGRVVVLDFWSESCAPCRALAPVLQELAAEYEDLDILKVNTDDHPEVVRGFGVVAQPTLVVFRHGEERGRLVGARSKTALERALARMLSPADTRPADGSSRA